jgi:hypothetical protein
LLIAGGHSVSLCVVNVLLGTALGCSIPFFHSIFREFAADNAATDDGGFPLYLNERLLLSHLLPRNLRVSLPRTSPAQFTSPH